MGRFIFWCVVFFVGSGVELGSKSASLPKPPVRKLDSPLSRTAAIEKAERLKSPLSRRANLRLGSGYFQGAAAGHRVTSRRLV